MREFLIRVNQYLLSFPPHKLPSFSTYKLEIFLNLNNLSLTPVLCNVNLSLVSANRIKCSYIFSIRLCFY